MMPRIPKGKSWVSYFYYSNFMRFYAEFHGDILRRYGHIGLQAFLTAGTALCVYVAYQDLQRNKAGAIIPLEKHNKIQEDSFRRIFTAEERAAKAEERVLLLEKEIQQRQLIDSIPISNLDRLRHPHLSDREIQNFRYREFQVEQARCLRELQISIVKELEIAPEPRKFKRSEE